jgi:hypothetical protein
MAVASKLVLLHQFLIFKFVMLLLWASHKMKITAPEISIPVQQKNLTNSSF